MKLHAPHRLATAFAAAALLLLQGACAALATYPPVAGGTPLTPGLPPVPEVMAKALIYAHARTGEGEPLLFNLPEGISPGVWASVAQTINTANRPLGLAEARPMLADDRRVWSVSQVRVRAFKAEVDVVYLDREVYQMATVHLASQPMRGYQAEYLQRWLIPIDAPVPHWPGAKPAAPAAVEPGAAEPHEGSADAEAKRAEAAAASPEPAPQPSPDAEPAAAPDA